MKVKMGSPMADAPKSMTIIIPAYNEADTIAECIRRVKDAGKRGLEWDIVISDNMSTDGTREILEKIDDPVQIAEKVSAFPRKARYM